MVEGPTPVIIELHVDLEARWPHNRTTPLTLTGCGWHVFLTRCVLATNHGHAVALSSSPGTVVDCSYLQLLY